MPEEAVHVTSDTGRSAVFRFLALIALILALLVLHRPDAITKPQFWAEDGVVYFLGQITSSGIGIVFQPYAGYLQIAPPAAGPRTALRDLVHLPDSCTSSRAGTDVFPPALFPRRRRERRETTFQSWLSERLRPLTRTMDWLITGPLVFSERLSRPGDEVGRTCIYEILSRQASGRLGTLEGWDPILSAYRERLSRTQRRIDNALPTMHNVENPTMNQINCGEFAMRRIRRPNVIAASPMRVNRTARAPRT